MLRFALPIAHGIAPRVVHSCVYASCKYPIRPVSSVYGIPHPLVDRFGHLREDTFDVLQVRVGILIFHSPGRNVQGEGRRV